MARIATDHQPPEAAYHRFQPQHWWEERAMRLLAVVGLLTWLATSAWPGALFRAGLRIDGNGVTANGDAGLSPDPNGVKSGLRIDGNGVNSNAGSNSDAGPIADPNG